MAALEAGVPKKAEQHKVYKAAEELAKTHVLMLPTHARGQQAGKANGRSIMTPLHTLTLTNHNSRH